MSELALPEGWLKKELSVLTQVITKGTTPTTLGYAYQHSGVNFLKVENIGDNKIDLKSINQYISDEANDALKRSQLVESDILFSIAGTIGKTALVSKEHLPMNTNQAIAIIRGSDSSLVPDFLKYQLQNFIEIIKLKSRGGAMNNVSLKDLKEFEVTVPAIAEQKEVVSFLDTHLTTVSQIQARLDAIPRLIEKFRQSVLNDAANGQLTQDWRRNNQISDWEWLEWFEITTKNKGAFKRGPFGSSLTKSMFVESGYKVYEQYCPINDDCSYARYYITPEKFEEMQQFEVLAGDLLISCSGVSLGRITKVPERYEKGIINQALLRVRLNHDIYNSEFFIMLFRSPLFQEIIFNNSTGSAIPNLKATKLLKQIPVPNVSLAEQEEIVKRVQMFFEYANQIDKSLTIAKARVNHLTQSILHQAFTGNLTAEWREKNPELISGENSAEALLAKIKAEKKKASKA